MPNVCYSARTVVTAPGQQHAAQKCVIQVTTEHSDLAAAESRVNCTSEVCSLLTGYKG